MIGIFKTQNNRLKVEQKLLTVEGFARWSNTTRFVYLSSLLPIGLLSSISLKTGFFSGVQLVPVKKSTRNYPDYTLIPSPTSESEIFFLAHKNHHVPTYSSYQMNELMHKIVKSRQYVVNQILTTGCHPYLYRMSNFVYNENITGLQNPFEFHSISGSTISAFITTMLSDLRQQIKNYDLIQKLTETTVPVTRLCHIRRDRWNPTIDMSKLFTFNELGFNQVQRKYKEKIVTCLVECVGSCDIQVQDPTIGFLGMRTAGFELDSVCTQKSECSEVDGPKIIKQPRIEIIDETPPLDGEVSFDSSMSLPDGKHRISASGTVTTSMISSSLDALAEKVSELVAAIPDQPAEVLDNVDEPKESSGIQKMGPDNLAKDQDNSSSCNRSLKFQKSTKPQTGGARESENGQNQSGRSNDSVPDSERPKGPDFPDNNTDSGPELFEVKIGPDRFVRAHTYVFSKTTIPDVLRNDIFVHPNSKNENEPGQPVFITKEGVVKVSGRQIGILGQDTFEETEYATTWDPDLDNFLQPTPSPSQRSQQSIPSPVYHPKKPLVRHPLSQFSELSTDSNPDPEIMDFITGKSRVTKTIIPKKPSPIITDTGTQTNNSGPKSQRPPTLEIGNKPVDECFREIIQKQNELNQDYKNFTDKFTTQVIDMPTTIMPSKVQLMNIIRSADDFASTLNLTQEQTGNFRKIVTEMVLELFQSTLGISLENNLAQNNMGGPSNSKSTVLSQMINNYTQMTTGQICKIESFPGCISTFQNKNTAAVMKVYQELSTTLDLHKEEMLRAVHETLSTANKILTETGSDSIQTSNSSGQNNSETLFGQSDSDEILAGDSDITPPENPGPSNRVSTIRAGQKRFQPEVPKNLSKRPRH